MDLTPTSDRDRLQPSSLAGRPILVTGGTGFIGGHLVKTLLQEKTAVRLLLRTQKSLPSEWRTIERIHGNLTDRSSLKRACQSIDTIFHTAGFAHAEADSRNAEKHWRINAEGTRFLIEAAAHAGVKRFVFLSSVLAMGPGVMRCIDEDWSLPPQTPYGQAKRAAEEAILEVGQAVDLHVVNLRLALVYGRGVKGNLQRLLKLARLQWLPTLPEGGKRSMVHVEDVVRAMLWVADHPSAKQKTYIVTDGLSYSSQQILNLMRCALGKPVATWQIPASVLQYCARAGDGWVSLTGKRVGFDSEALDKLLGWAWYCSDRIQRELAFSPSRTLDDSLPEMLITKNSS